MVKRPSPERRQRRERADNGRSRHGERTAAFDSKGTFGCGPLSRWVLTRIGNAAGGHKILTVVGDRI